MAGRAAIPRSLAVTAAIVLVIATVGPAASVFAADAPEEDAARHKKAVKTIAKTFKQLKIKDAPIVLADGIADGVESQTGQRSSMPRSADPVAVGYAVVEMGKPQVNVFNKKGTAKNSAAIIGDQAMSAGQRWLIVVVVTDQQFKKGNAGGPQALLGLVGPKSMPIFPGGMLDTLAGRQTVIISGQFPEFDQLLTGTTPLVGLMPGDSPAWNSGDAKGFGFQLKDVWLLGYPINNDTDAFTLTFQSDTAEQRSIDRITTPDGVGEFPIAATTTASAIPEGFCSRVEPLLKRTRPVM